VPVAAGQVPADDPEAVFHGGLEPGTVEPPIGSFGDGHKAADPRVGRGHDPQEPFDLVDVAHQLGSGEDVTPAQPDALRPALFEVQLPLAPAWGQQRRALPDVAHRLPIALPGLASGEEHEHEPAAERRRERKAQNRTHGDVDHAHHPRLDAPAERAVRTCDFGRSLLQSGLIA